jgi:hypothetical protein
MSDIINMLTDVLVSFLTCGTAMVVLFIAIAITLSIFVHAHIHL